jgi:hypothetical protein
VDDASQRRSSARMRSKLQNGSVPLALWSGQTASERSSRRPERARPPSRSAFARAAAPRSPAEAHFQGVSTSWVSATAKRAPPQRGGSMPSRRRRRSRGGSRGSSAETAARNRSCSSRAPFRSSIRARWKNASASSSPSGRSPRSTCSQASAWYGTSSPKPSSRAPIVSRTQRALRSTPSGISGTLRGVPGPHGRGRASGRRGRRPRPQKGVAGTRAAHRA